MTDQDEGAKAFALNIILRSKQFLIFEIIFHFDENFSMNLVSRIRWKNLFCIGISFRI